MKVHKFTGNSVGISTLEDEASIGLMRELHKAVVRDTAAREDRAFLSPRTYTDAEKLLDNDPWIGYTWEGYSYGRSPLIPECEWCGALLDLNRDTCAGCGASISKEQTCPGCGRTWPESFTKCWNGVVGCGRSLDET